MRSQRLPPEDPEPDDPLDDPDDPDPPDADLPEDPDEPDEPDIPEDPDVLLPELPLASPELDAPGALRLDDPGTLSG